MSLNSRWQTLTKIKSEDREANALNLIHLWLSRDGNWVPYSEVRKIAEEKGFNKRTLSRFLNWLVKENRLEVRRKGPRKREFKPTVEYWDKMFKWIPISPEANDAEYLFFTELASEITKKFDQAKLKVIEVRQKSQNHEARGLTRQQLNKLNDKIATLIRAIRLDLSREYFNEDVKTEAVYALLRGNVKRTVMAYLDLWLFLTETHGAREEFARQMNCVQRKVSKMK